MNEENIYLNCLVWISNNLPHVLVLPWYIFHMWDNMIVFFLIHINNQCLWIYFAWLWINCTLAFSSGGRIDQLCTGVAARCPTADLETRSVFNFLKGIDQIPSWLDAVMFAVCSHGDEQTLRNFSEKENDCPLHAVLRYVIKTGNFTNCSKLFYYFQ